jgi:3-hydroxyisobutyrate dehydrogenase
MSTKPKIGWIGLGVMGSPMLYNLLKAGYEVSVYTRTKSKAETVLDAGAQWIDQINDLAGYADILCTMVGYPEDLEAVVLGKGGTLAGMKPGSLLIDFTTSCPELAKRIAEAASEKGVLSLDAPVSGGDIGAKGGTLAIMCGGSDEAFTKAEPVLQKLGDKIKHFGGAGSGQRVKMSNQILIASTMVGMVESMLYAERAGLEVSEVIELIGKGAAGCWSINQLGPRILKNDWKPGFYVKHFLKDMKIALDDSQRIGLKLEGLALAKKFYSMTEAYDFENDGTQALMKILRSLNSK